MDTRMSELIEGFDTETLEGMIENEGLDYFFNGYISVEDITNEELREAVMTYLDARTMIIHTLEKHGINAE